MKNFTFSIIKYGTICALLITSFAQSQEIGVLGNGNYIADNDLTPTAFDFTDFTATNSRTFTLDNIQNSGNIALNVTSITLSNSSDFSITTNPAPIGVGKNDLVNFVITYIGSGSGTITSNVIITSINANNDGADNSWIFRISKTVASNPEINIVGNGVSIADNDITPSPTDDTDFGNVDVTSGTKANIFTIQNLGTSNLNLTGGAPYVVISGLNASDFTLTANPSSPIGASSNTTFTVTFNPSAIGLRTATVTIANNDSNENPYNFNIQGNGFSPLPEINVQGNATNIVDGDITPSLVDGTDFGSVNFTSGTQENTFTIENIGSSTLNLTGSSPHIIILGANASDFTVTAIPSASIAAGGSTTFNITFNPSAIGIRMASIVIPNNDSDEQPYNFNIQGLGSDEKAPGGVTANLGLWLKGTDGLSYTDGQSVNLWQDKGNASNATVNTAGQEPTYYDNTAQNINFNPVVNFDNASTSFENSFNYSNLPQQYLEGTSGYYTNDIFIVLIPNTTVNSSFGSMDIFCSDHDTSNQENDGSGIGFGAYSQRFSQEVICYAYAMSNGVNNGFGVSQNGTSHSYNNVGIINARHNPAATSQELHYNANNIVNNTSDVGSFGTISNEKFWIGRSEGWRGSYDGRIAEIITYSSRKTDTNLTQERNRIQSYLAIKYGITLGTNGTSQDYVDSSGNIIWDQSNNASYNYDIAGIGRDDASDLNQKQSRSVNNATDGTGRIEGIVTMGLTDIYDTNNLNKLNNATELNDKQYLVWGNNGVDLDLAAATINVNMSSGISGLSTNVSFTAMQRVWKVVENGGDIPTVKVKIPQAAVRNITPPGNYYMFISATGVFDPTADYRVMTSDGNGNLETNYDFDGTKYITFGYAPQVIVDRSVYFNGVQDYIDIENNLNLNTSEFTLSAWVLREAGSTNTSILSKRDAAFTEGYDFKINNSGRFEVTWRNGIAQTITSSVVIPENKWHHLAIIYSSGVATLYVDGVPDTSASKLPPPTTSQSFYIAAAGKNTPTAFFKGNIDEVRVWDKALTVNQLRFVMNQEIKANGGFVSGTNLPTTISKNEVSTIPWTKLAGYYPMSTFTYTNTDDASGNGHQGALRNLNTVDKQTAPLPYISQADGDWSSSNIWMNNAVQNLPNDLSIVDGTTPIAWNIVETNHNIYVDTEITLGRQRELLGLKVNSNTLKVGGNNAAKTGNGLIVTHYLKLDGKIDLEGESQLIQTLGSDLDPTSSGSLEKDQQGTADTFTYNYWSSPVGATNAITNNNSYKVTDVMRDGTIPVTFLNSGYNGSAGTPIKIADYWIWKFSNQPDNDYSAWQHIRRTGSISAGEGFTMKGPGTGSILDEQNYVYIGKPNNGDITLTLNAGNDFLVGNPYASAIDANQFITDNGPNITGAGADPLISGTLYFWEHWGGGSHNLGDYQGGYATYNFSGATAAPSYGTNDPDVGTGGTPSKLPGRYIPVNQGFFVVGENTGTINFNNGQRVFRKENPSTSVFVRNAQNNTNSTENNDVDTRMKFRIGFNSINTIHRQLLLTLDENATTGYDWGYDAILFGDQMDDLFWMIDNEKYNIQGSSPIESDSAFPLGIKTKTNGLNTITIDALENVPSNLTVFIHDKDIDTYHNLSESDFEFYLNSGTYLDKFELTFSQEALSITENELNTLEAYYSNQTKSIVLLNPNFEAVKSIELINIIGQSISIIKNISEMDYSEYKVKNLSAGTYIIKIHIGSGSVSKKVIIK